MKFHVFMRIYQPGYLVYPKLTACQAYVNGTAVHPHKTMLQATPGNYTNGR